MFKKKKQKREQPKIKIAEKYSRVELNNAIFKLMKISEELPRNEKQSLERLLARATIYDFNMGHDILETLSDMGIYERIDHGYYIVPDTPATPRPQKEVIKPIGGVDKDSPVDSRPRIERV